jgi:hypothetical protein
MSRSPCFYYNGETIPIERVAEAGFYWGIDAHKKIDEGKFHHYVRTELKHGRAAIDELFHITSESDAEINPELVDDVLALAMEIGATRIIERAQQALAKLHVELNDRLKCEEELKLSTALTEQKLRSLSIPDFLKTAREWQLILPTLDRCVPPVNNSDDNALLFRFLIDCPSSAHIPLFRYLPYLAGV